MLKLDLMKNAIFIINDTKIITRLLEGDFIDYKNYCQENITAELN